MYSENVVLIQSTIIIIQIQHEICYNISLPGPLIPDHVEFQFHDASSWPTWLLLAAQFIVWRTTFVFM